MCFGSSSRRLIKNRLLENLESYEVPSPDKSVYRNVGSTLNCSRGSSLRVWRLRQDRQAPSQHAQSQRYLAKQIIHANQPTRKDDVWGTRNQRKSAPLKTKGAAPANQSRSFDRTKKLTLLREAGAPTIMMATKLQGLAAALVALGLCCLLAVGSLAAPAPSPAAEARGECLAAPSRILGHAVPYCVILPPGYAQNASRRYPVLYYFHGLGDNEQMFVRSGGFDLIEDLRDRHQLGDFIIVSPAGYASFFMNSHDARRRYDDFFLQEFMPMIENRYRIAARRESRGIGGISMGGYGALRMAFLHPQLFGSVSAHSAALMERLPAVSLGDSPESGRLRILGDVFGSPPDRLFWERNNPLKIAATAELAGMKIYFDCGSQDDYGFEAGAQALDRVLSSRRIAHEFHLYPGGHNWSYFAAHLPDSLRFHSEAFGGRDFPARSKPIRR